MPKFTYDDLVVHLQKDHLSYITLMYANTSMCAHLSEQKTCDFPKDYVVGTFAHQPEMNIQLTRKGMDSLIMDFCKGDGLSYDVKVKVTAAINAHFIRARVINAIVEVIKKYYKDSPNWFKLHSLDWFRVLYVLRNVASHADGFEEVIKFPTWKKLTDQYPNTITWNGITINNGHTGNVEYADKQIISLVEHTINFFKSNRAQWE
jgi:hypothetical protein